jgi:glycosyltransferase involved in cell wall biosynthesis
MVKTSTCHKQKTALFYASAPSKKMFSIQKFYRTDIQILRELGYRVRLSTKAVDFLKFWTYDFAFIYFYRYGLFCAIFSRIFLKKVFFTGGIDSLDQEWANKKAYRIQKLLFKACTLFSTCNILVSNADIKNIKRFRPVLNEARYPKVFHAIEVDKFRKESIDQREKIVTTVVWMYDLDNVKRKGVDRSIQFFKKLHELDSDFRMVIIGPFGKGTETLRELIAREHLEPFIHFTGTISDNEKIEWLQKSMIYTQLSIYEGFGIAAIEALAAGNIVIHSGKGGLSDGIGKYGILANNNHWDALSKDVIAILSNTETWNTYISNGVRHVSENFDYPVRKKAFQQIFSNIL